jgi:signal transduction histidine kinase/CheY-like chemotaxis protein
MNESIVLGLIQNIAILLAFAMLYENFWLRNDNPRSLPSKIFAGFVLGGIGVVLMYTPWTMIPGLVFDTRSVMLAISGLFFGAIPTVIAMTVVAAVRFLMGGEGMLMGVTVIIMSGTIGILWGKVRKEWERNNMKMELLMLGIVVHVAMLASTLLLPSERIVPALETIALPIMLIHAPGTMLLGLILAAQKNHMENRLAKAKFYDAERQFSLDLILKQKQLHKQVNKYAKLTQKFQEQNNELKAAKEKAEESDRLKSSFLANLSHEIRTPMNAIIGFTDLLELDELTGEQREQYIQIVRHSGEYLLGIINDIIEISHIESGQVEFKVKEVNVESFLEELYNTMKFTAAAGKNVEFRLDKVPKEVPRFILADEIKLKQIIINLLNNAFKFTNEGAVSFGCYLEDHAHLSFFVRDTGIGIEVKNHQVIFERFRQVENRSIQKVGGSGLGLAIVKAYVDLMGGSIKVESDTGKGSEFIITLPLQYPGKRKPEIKVKPVAMNVSGKKNLILVAEDEEINWLLLNQILTSGNYLPMRAVNGREAVELCRTNDNIDLVLMDIKMPEMNGYEAREEIRRFKPGLPIIAQTAYALPADIERLKKSFSDYITKPINRHLLMEKIETVWNSCESREEAVTEGD